MNFDTSAPVVVKGFVIWSGQSGADCDPASYAIYGSNTTSGWNQNNSTLISFGTIYPFLSRQSAQTILFSMNNATYQRYLVRFNISTDSTSSYMELSEFQLLTSSDPYFTYAAAYPTITALSYGGSPACSVNGLRYYNCSK